MCGFIGCISKEPISYSDFNKVNKYIVCRGPDRNIYFNSDNKKFKHNLGKYFHLVQNFFLPIQKKAFLNLAKDLSK